MKFASYKLITYVSILVGAGIAIYANAQNGKSTYLLIVGIALLLFGLMRLSRTLPSKKQDDNDPYRFL